MSQTTRPQNTQEIDEEQARQDRSDEQCMNFFKVLFVVFIALYFWLPSKEQREKEERRKEFSASYEGRVQLMIEDSFSNLEQCQVIPQVDGGYAVHVKWKMVSGWSSEGTRKGVFMEIHDFFLSRASKGGDLSQVVRYWFDPQVDAVDKYGTEKVVMAAKILIPRETINRINWDGFDWRMLMDLCESEGMVTWQPVVLDKG